MGRAKRKPGERAAIIKRWRAIRASYQWKVPLSPEDDEFVRLTFQGHPDIVEKTGVGIDHFYVDDDGQRSYCIWAIRLDKTRVAISLYACLDQPNPFRQFSDACRAVISGDVMQAKNIAFSDPDEPFAIRTTIVCPVLGVKIPYEQTHAHHADPWTFKKIVEAFLKSRPDIDQGDLASYVCREPGTATKITLKDQRLANDFYSFHKERAKLIIVSAKAHTSKGLRKSDVAN